MRKIGNPARCCCPPCLEPMKLSLTVALQACCAIADDVDVEFFLGTTSLGTCTISPSITQEFDSVSKSFILHYFPATCEIDVDLALDETVTWTAVGALIGSHSGTLITACGTVAAAINWYWVDWLPSALYVNDPDGNAVPLSETGPDTRIWKGSWTYTRDVLYGADKTFTIDYTWQSCKLTAIIRGEGAGTTFNINPYLNVCGHSWEGEVGGPVSDFDNLPYYVPPPDPSITCDPLVAVYQSWSDMIGSSFRPGVLKKWGCTCNSPLFGVRFDILGNQWKMFNCGGAWTVTL